MRGVELLEEYLAFFKGAVILISHDRRFVNRIADRIFIIENRKVVQFLGNYEEYLIHKKTVQEKSAAAGRILQLENRLSAVVGKFSAPSKQDEYSVLDVEYKASCRSLKPLSVWRGINASINFLLWYRVNILDIR